MRPSYYEHGKKCAAQNDAAPVTSLRFCGLMINDHRVGELVENEAPGGISSVL